MFAKLNRGIGYVQGMNEVLVPIYVVMVTDKHPNNVGTKTFVSVYACARIYLSQLFIPSTYIRAYLRHTFLILMLHIFCLFVVDDQVQICVSGFVNAVLMLVYLRLFCPMAEVRACGIGTRTCLCSLYGQVSPWMAIDQYGKTVILVCRFFEPIGKSRMETDYFRHSR